MTMPHDPLREARIKATRLLKAFRAGDIAAARRLDAKGDFVRPQLKHALDVVAREWGHSSYVELKRSVERVETRVDTELFFARYQPGGYINAWFKTYDEAALDRAQSDGFLFPHREHFVVCSAGFVEDFGGEPTDPDWTLIGRDWARPNDPGAFARLSRRLIAMGYAS